METLTWLSSASNWMTPFKYWCSPSFKEALLSPTTPFRQLVQSPVVSCILVWKLPFTLYDSLFSIPIGQFSSLAECSTQKNLSSPLQLFSVLVPDGGQGMWEMTGAVVWTESWRRGWKISTAVSACKLPFSKPALMVCSGLEILSLPCAFGQASSQVGQPLLKTPGPEPCRCILHWGLSDNHGGGLRSDCTRGHEVVLWCWVHKSSGRLLTEKLCQTVRDALHSLFNGSVPFVNTSF